MHLDIMSHIKAAYMGSKMLQHAIDVTPTGGACRCWNTLSAGCCCASAHGVMELQAINAIAIPD
jgi:hypothetical protein